MFFSIDFSSVELVVICWFSCNLLSEVVHFSQQICFLSELQFCKSVFLHFYFCKFVLSKIRIYMVTNV